MMRPEGDLLQYRQRLPAAPQLHADQRGATYGGIVVAERLRQDHRPLPAVLPEQAANAFQTDRVEHMAQGLQALLSAYAMQAPVAIEQRRLPPGAGRAVRIVVL